MRSKVRVSVASGLAALAFAGACAHALTIEEALAEAVRSNPALNATRDTARASHEGVVIARSAWMPTIQATAGARHTRIESVNDLPRYLPGGGRRTSDSELQSLELAFTQNLFRSGRDAARLRQATAEVLRQHALVEFREQELILEVATAYLDVLRTERIVELREASLAAIKAQVRETEAQFRVGDRTRTDMAQAEAEREIATVEVLSAQTEAEITQFQFQALVGVRPDHLENAAEPSDLPASLEDALLAARRDEPLVRATGAALRASEEAVRAARAELGPRVDVRGTVTRSLDHGGGFSGSNSNETSTVVGVQLTIPLYQAGAGGAQLRRAIHERARRRDEHRSAVLSSELAAVDAWRRLEAARRRHTAFTAAVEASRQVLTGVLREADVGERTVREVLDAETDLVLHQVRALSAERDAVVGAYRLIAATGRLTARRLGISGTPDLEREAATTRRNLTPGLLLLTRALGD